MGRPFAAGDRVLLVDSKRRRHLVTLAEGGTFHTHAGVVAHDALIGRDEGLTVRTTLGTKLIAVRPTLAEYVLKMPRGAQVIYPKDLGPILVLADLFPGARVLETGIGSGALTMTLLRAIGPTGHVTGYEIRADFADRARRNIEGFLGSDLPLDVEVRDAYDGIDVHDLDRVLLDLPEPWRAVKHAEAALRPGGILLAYLPTIGQVARLREELASSAFGMTETLEVLQRHWHVDGQSVRPDHRMVAHTGFLTHARLLVPRRVNVLDLVVIAAMIAAGYFGYRLGFVARVVSWGGLALGIVLAVAFVDDVMSLLSGQASQTRLFVALLFFLLLASGGQALGYAAGVTLRRRLPSREGVYRSDRVGGAVVGVLGVLAAVWLLTPAFASAQGWPARAARDSQVVRAVNRYAPDPPPQAQRLGRAVAEGPFPEVFSRLNGPRGVGAPPTSALAPDVAGRVASSVLKIQGEACDQIQAGSGFVVGANLVVTNAHVVAGEPRTEVDTNDGRRLPATVVAFDPERDLAVLRVRNLRLFALPFADGNDGTTGAVFGHPGGGPLRIAPARIAETVNASGTDIYRTGRTSRRVHVLAADLAAGDSGGPLVDEQGRMVGVAFAVDPGQESTAYALTRGEVDSVLGPVLDGGGQTSADTGPCLVG